MARRVSAVRLRRRRSSGLKVYQANLELRGDPARVITRCFLPGYAGAVERICQRVAALPEDEVNRLLGRLLERYAARHKHIAAVFERNCAQATAGRCADPSFSPARRQLLGAYFTMEYCFESVALFNPSIVPHPDQSGLPEGCCRFILSLRACGEGHVSSIEFRTGGVTRDGRIWLDPVSPYTASESRHPDQRYEKHPFRLKLGEMGAYNPLAEQVLAELGESFQLDELERAIERHRGNSHDSEYVRQTLDSLAWLARSNYHLEFPEDSALSERVIFPVSENEARGIEDARFVRFVDDDGRVEYFATYSAYNGLRVLPQFIETSDFRRFKIVTLNGRYAQHKGMALFPRRIDGRYLMIARVDGENLYLLPSDNRHFWNEAELLQQPRQPWEFVQIGNCGSPLETPAGWLVITHGVGPLRQYCLGALLLDRDDPARVIGQLAEPLIGPDGAEVAGHVPGAVYSCGGLIHGGLLVIPYACADTVTRIALVPLDDLLDRLLR